VLVAKAISIAEAGEKRNASAKSPIFSECSLKTLDDIRKAR
jgi:hypothetical protein